MGCCQSSEISEFQTFRADLHKRRRLKNGIDVEKQIHDIQIYMEEMEHSSSYNSIPVRHKM